MRAAAPAGLLLAGGLAVGLAGCTTRTSAIAIPPDQLPTVDAARDDIARMTRDPRPLARPVLVFSGWGDPGVVSLHMASALREVAFEPRVAAQQFFTSWTMEHCRRNAVAAAAALVPEDRPADAGPLEIDVVGKSMGGLIARELARDQADADDPVVRVVRIFNISASHRGARLVALPTLEP